MRFLIGEKILKLIKLKTILIGSLGLSVFHFTPIKTAAPRPSLDERLDNCKTQCLICSVKLTRLILPVCKSAMGPSRFDPLCRRPGRAFMRMIDDADARLDAWEKFLTAPDVQKMA